MTELQSTIAATSERSDAVNSKLGAHREQIEQLNGVRNLIKKLQAVFDLPQRLRVCIAQNAVGLAVKYYAGAAPLLAKYGEEGAFAGVKEEVDAAVAEITGKLKAGMATAAAAAKRQQAARVRRAAAAAACTDTYTDDTADDTTDMTENTTDSATDEVTDLGLDMSECVALLEKLGTPAGELQNDYLSSRRLALESALTAAEASLSISTSASTSVLTTKRSADPRDFVVALDHAFLADFHSAASEYLELFPADRAPLVAAGRELFGRYFKIARAAFSSDDAIAGIGAVVYVAGTVVGGGGGEVRGLLPAKALMVALATMAADLSGIHRMLPEAALGDRAAEVVERAVRSRVGAAFTSLEANLADALAAAAEVVAAAPYAASKYDNAGLSSDDGSGSDMRLDGNRQLSVSQPIMGAGAGGGALLLRQFVILSDVLLSGVAEVLADVRALLEERPLLVSSWRQEFEGMVHGRATSLMHALLAHLCAVGGSTRRSASGLNRHMFSPNSPLAPSLTREQPRRSSGASGGGEESGGAPYGQLVKDDGGSGGGGGAVGTWATRSTTPTPLLLVYARLATFLQTDGVPHIARELESFFPGAGGSSDGTGGGGGRFCAEECLRMSAEAATSLISAYVEASGRRLSLMVRTSLATPNWLDMKEPRDVRPLADFLLDDLAGIEAEIAQILEDGGHGGVGRGGEESAATAAEARAGAASSGASAPLSPVSGLGRARIERGVANLFQDRPQIFAPVEATQASVLTGVVRIALKSLAECVRCQTLGRAGYHQLSLDIAYLSPRVRRFASADVDGKTIDLLLEEAASAAVDRSLDPTPLEPAILRRILDAKVAKQQRV